VLSLDDACALVAARGLLMAELPRDGAMVAIQAGEREVVGQLEDLKGRLALAAVNGPASVVVSGEERCALEVAAHWETLGRKVKRLRVSHAFHSPLMEDMVERFAEVARGLSFSPPRIPIVSNVTGSEADPEQVCSPSYWVGHVRAPVRFFDGAGWLREQGVRSFLELGPDAVLSAMARDCLPAEEEAQASSDAQSATYSIAPMLRAGREEVATSLRAVAEMWVGGVGVDWAALLRRPQAALVRLPTYAFQRQRHWIGTASVSAGGAAVGTAGAESHPLLAGAVEMAGGEGWLFSGSLSLREQPWLGDHRMMGIVLVPGTTWIELALEAGRRAGLELVRELVMETPLVLSEQEAVSLQVTIGERDEWDGRPVRIYSRSHGEADAQADGAGEWVCRASGVLARRAGTDEAAQALAELAAQAAESWPPEGAAECSVEDLYGTLARLGVEYGPAFTGVRAAWRRGEEVYAEIGLPADQHGLAARFGVHPALLDAALQSVGTRLVGDGQSQLTQMAIPFAWGGVAFESRGASSLRVRGVIDARGVSLLAIDEHGAPVAAIDSMLARPVVAEQLKRAGQRRDSLFALSWTPRPGGQASYRPKLALIADGRTPLEDDLRAAVADSHDDPESMALALQAVQASPWTAVVACPGGPPLEQQTGDERGSAARRTEPCGEAQPDAGTVGRAHLAARQALELAQRWLADERFASVRLAIVTRRAVSALVGERALDLAQACALGLLRCAQAENPGRLVLVDIDESPGSLAALADALAGDEPQLAIRDGQVLVPRLVRAASPDAPKPGASPAAGEEPREPGHAPGEFSGTALVTGGTGVLGALVARHLVGECGVRRIVLASRRGAAAPGAQELQRELEAGGAEVLIAECDVARREQLRELIEGTPEDAPLRVVVHTAGVLEDGVIGSLTAEKLDRVLEPKADAAWHLHELTAQCELSAFVLFSSIAGVFGTPGQGNYAAANAFLDALAAHRRARGLPACSIAWGVWEQIAGMAGDLTPADRARMANMGVSALSESEGLELFDAALRGEEPLAVALRLDFGALRRLARSGLLPALLSRLVRVPSSPQLDGARRSLARKLQAAPRQRHPVIVASEVRSHVAAVLGHASAEEVSMEHAFLELGFDSLAATELRNRLVAVTGLQLAPTLIFDHNTPADLAAHLAGELARQQPGAGAHGSEAEVSAVAATAPGGTLSALLREAADLRALDEFMAMLATASRFRPTFDDPAQRVNGWVRLAGGERQPAIVCCPSLLAIGGPHEYVNFAKAFAGSRAVYALPLLGFAEGEPLPGSLETALAAQAEAVRGGVGDCAFLLVGHSSGGMAAHALAARLEDIGSPAAGLVLIDTYARDALTGVLPHVMGEILSGERAGAIGDSRLMAMGAYFRMFSEWQPRALSSPVLLLRASEPLPGQAREGEWQAAYDFADSVVTVPGNHFTMIQEHAHAAVQAMEEWIA
jgi:malonyl CoA-acyl carrier protein transacylase/thioesterase domain-containing protein/acyl carrier protein